MPRYRYPKSKYESLPASKKQAMQEAGVEIYDDTSMNTPSAQTTHEDAYGVGSTTLDHSPAKDSRYKDRAAELRATKGHDLMLGGHTKGGLMWDKGKVDLGMDVAPNVGAGGKPLTRGGRPVIGQTPEERASLERSTLRTAGAIGGAMVGGPPGARIGGVAGSLIGQAIGVGAGDLAGQALTPQAGPVRPGESAMAGGIDLLTGAAMHGTGALLGRAGGVSKEAIREGALRPGEILNPPVRDEYYDLAHGISRDAQRRMDPRFHKTQPRADLEAMYQGHAAAGGTVDAYAVVDSLDNQIRGLANPQDHTIDATLGAFRDRMLDRLSRSAPSGRMTAMEMDAMIREEMGQGLKKFYETMGGSAYIKRVARARGESARSLYSQVDPGGGAAALGKEANRQLKVTERVGKLVPVGSEVREITSSPQALRAAMSPSNVGKGVALERALKNYDSLHGTSYFRQMNDLSLREQWSPLDKESAAEIAGFVMATGYRNRGALQRSATFLGKQAVRAGVPAVKSRALLGSGAAQAWDAMVPSHEPAE